MMSHVVLELPENIYKELLTHLLPTNIDKEQAAFLFAKTMPYGNSIIFQFVEWQRIDYTEFTYHSEDYLELTDQARARVIKRAHDLETSIIEFHSHPRPEPAIFSWSDRQGLEEFVPHVWWRLKGKPYMAIVVSPSSLDALVWLTDPKTPQSLGAIKVGKRTLYPTGLTIKHWRKIYV